jgi:hypothetical protein
VERAAPLTRASRVEWSVRGVPDAGRRRRMGIERGVGGCRGVGKGGLRDRKGLTRLDWIGKQEGILDGSARFFLGCGCACLWCAVPSGLFGYWYYACT